MRKRLAGVLCLALLLGTFCGCHIAGGQSVEFPELGIQVNISCDETHYMGVNHNEDTPNLVLAEEKEDVSNSLYGFVHFSAMDETCRGVDDAIDYYISSLTDCTVEEISPALKFIEYNGIIPANGQPDRMYMFVYFDEATHIAAYGRFFPNNIDKSEALGIAKSLSFKKIEQKSLFPEDYTEIKPVFTIESTGEQVTDYYVSPSVWKGTEYTPLPPEEALKDAEVYELSSRDSLFFTFEERYLPYSHNAVLQYASEPEGKSLFLEGMDYRITYDGAHPDDVCYVTFYAYYGKSGTISYTFKCQFKEGA